MRTGCLVLSCRHRHAGHLHARSSIHALADQSASALLVRTGSSLHASARSGPLIVRCRMPACLIHAPAGGLGLVTIPRRVERILRLALRFRQRANHKTSIARAQAQFSRSLERFQRIVNGFVRRYFVGCIHVDFFGDEGVGQSRSPMTDHPDIPAASKHCNRIAQPSGACGLQQSAGTARARIGAWTSSEQAWPHAAKAKRGPGISVGRTGATST